LEFVMFPYDDSPDHVAVTPAASAHLSALAADRGGLTVLLTAHGVTLLPPGTSTPSGAVKLGDLESSVMIAGADDTPTEWWRTRATLDLTEQRDVSVALTSLSEEELYAALAAGPLPRL
jgi:hypothetical protein